MLPQFIAYVIIGFLLVWSPPAASETDLNGNVTVNRLEVYSEDEESTKLVDIRSGMYVTCIVINCEEYSQW